MIYLDTSIVILVEEGTNALGDRARSVIEQAAPGTVFAASLLVTMECLVKPFRLRDIRLEDRYRETLSGFEHLPIPDAAYERAARLRAGGRLKTPDALHLAIAQLGGCRELWTADAGLAAASHGFARDIIGGEIE